MEKCMKPTINYEHRISLVKTIIITDLFVWAPKSAIKPTPAGALPVYFGAAPDKEPHLKPLPASTGEVEPRNVAPSSSVSRHHY